jgi:hypothetical protein
LPTSQRQDQPAVLRTDRIVVEPRDLERTDLQDAAFNLAIRPRKPAFQPGNGDALDTGNGLSGSDELADIDIVAETQIVGVKYASPSAWQRAIAEII